MINILQVKVNEEEFKEAHEKQLDSLLGRVQEIFPKNSKVEGVINGTDGNYEGRIHINTRIGRFVAKAKAKNLFSLIAKLHAKIMRQIVNWPEKGAAKRRYQRRKHRLALVTSEE